MLQTKKLHSIACYRWRGSFPDNDEVEIEVTSLTRITDNQTNELILEDKRTELEKIEKWVDKKIESSIKYIKNYGMDEKYLAEK